MCKLYFKPILTYASETWTMTKKDQSRIQAIDMKFLRSTIQKTRRDKIRNEEIRDKLNMEKLQDTIDNSRIKWMGHIMRMEEERLPKQALKLKGRGKRPLGRPRKRWLDQVKEDVEKRGVTWQDIVEGRMWQDRDRWRLLSRTVIFNLGYAYP